MKVYILMRTTYIGLSEHGPDVVAVYANLVDAKKERDSLKKRQYARGQFWVLTRTVKEQS